MVPATGSPPCAAAADAAFESAATSLTSTPTADRDIQLGSIANMQLAAAEGCVMPNNAALAARERQRASTGSLFAAQAAAAAVAAGSKRSSVASVGGGACSLSGGSARGPVLGPVYAFSCRNLRDLLVNTSNSCSSDPTKMNQSIPPSSHRDRPATVPDAYSSADTNSTTTASTGNSGMSIGTSTGTSFNTSSNSVVAEQSDDTLLHHDHYDVVLLDVRAIGQYNREHIRGAINISLPTTLIRRPAWTMDRLMSEAGAGFSRARRFIMGDTAMHESSNNLTENEQDRRSTLGKNPVYVCIIDDPGADCSSRRVKSSDVELLFTQYKEPCDKMDIITGIPSRDSRAALVLAKLQTECVSTLRIGWLVGSMEKFRSLYPHLVTKGVPSTVENRTKGTIPLTGLTLHGFARPVCADSFLQTSTATNCPLGTVNEPQYPSCGFDEKASSVLSQRNTNIENATIAASAPRHTSTCVVNRSMNSDSLFNPAGILEQALFLVDDSAALRTPNGAVRHMDDISEIPTGFEFLNKSEPLPLSFPFLLRKLAVQKPDRKTYLARQFMELRLQSVLQTSVSMSAKCASDMFCVSEAFGHQGKDRFNNILPYNYNRIRLETPFVDYINASMISLPKRRYIASQAPLKNTLYDFWRMTWEQNSPVVIMLCKEVENNRDFCSQYWPDIDPKEPITRLESIYLMKRELDKPVNLKEKGNSVLFEYPLNSEAKAIAVGDHNLLNRKTRKSASRSGIDGRINESSGLRGQYSHNLNDTPSSNWPQGLTSSTSAPSTSHGGSANLSGTESLTELFHPAMYVKRTGLYSIEGGKFLVHRIVLDEVNYVGYKKSPSSSVFQAHDSFSQMDVDVDVFSESTGLSNDICASDSESKGVDPFPNGGTEHIGGSQYRSSATWNNPKVCYLVQYTNWPDLRVPDQPMDIVNLSILSRMLADGLGRGPDSVPPSSSHKLPPYVVHCAAGCGRTGSFVATDYLLNFAGIFLNSANVADVMGNFGSLFFNQRMAPNNDTDNMADNDNKNQEQEDELLRIRQAPPRKLSLDSLRARVQQNILSTTSSQCSLENVTVEGIVQELRRQRQDMVQNVIQFGFIYECLYQACLFFLGSKS